MTMDQEYIPGDATKSTSIRQQLIESLRQRGVTNGVIPMSLASRIDPDAYPGQSMDLGGIRLRVKS